MQDRAAAFVAALRRQAAARKRETLLKKDFLRAQLRDIVEAYADALRMRGEGAPQDIREKLDGRLTGFVEETARDLSGHVQQGLMREQPVGEMTARLRGAFEAAGKSAGGYGVLLRAVGLDTGVAGNGA